MAKKAKKKIVRREYTKDERQGIAGAFKGEDAVGQDRKVDQEDRRLVASESIKVGYRSGPSAIEITTLRPATLRLAFRRKL